jgi:signal transduction histidine kinase/ligand-binding sensor domain-containing protein/DNA-binding response OmpR family regulator
LKEALSYLTVILLFASCNSDKQSTDDEMPPLYPAPQTVALNTKEGYIINPVTGDSIQPIINSFGDTLKTGVPVPAIGKAIHPDSVSQPKIVPAGEPKVVPTNLNVHKIPDALTVIPVNKDSLKTFTPGVDTSSFVLVNSNGDTVPTGVPIPVKGKVVPCIQPQPVKALPPRMKDNFSINMKYLDVDQGMNSSYVYSILEDSHGNLWFGTNGGGVSKYNGITFTHFTEKEGLSNDVVFSILEDSQGYLWFGTADGGVSMYNGETFTHFTQKEGLSNNFVLSILEDSHGNLWFGTYGGGVSMYNGETFTHFTQKEGLSNNRVISILEDSHGNLWFGTLGGGVSMYNGESFTHFTEKEGLSNNYVNSILEDSHGNLWFGTDGGASMYNGESFTHFTEKEGLSNNSVESILEDSHGNLWFGTYDRGLNKYSGETFTHFTEKEGLSNNSVTSILEDSHGNLWFGTNGGGVSMYNSETFKYFTEKEGLSNNSVRSILEDSLGNLWFGTYGGGVSIYNGETFSHLTKKEGLSDNTVYCILEDSHGNLWFGTHYGGVSMYNGESFTHFTEKEGLSNNLVRSILEDSHGNLWFGTSGGGVSKYNGESFTHFTEKEGLSNNSVTYILEDSHGNLWFVTNVGVIKYNGESFTYFTEKEGLSNNIVLSILEDSSSNMWISTYRGLNRLVFGPDRVSGVKSSLYASGVKEDSVNASFYHPVIHTYNKQDGLKGIDFYLNSMLLDSKNQIWWGGGKELTMLGINDFKIPVEPPTLQLKRIEINEQFLDYRHLNDSAGMEMKFDSVAKFYNYPLNLELPHKLNHLTFHFSAIDWSAPHKIRYSFKMEGLNDNWSNPTAEAKADYRSLPYGTYNFKVRAIGEAQKWSEPFDYTFTIRPPWWFTWWAYTIYGIVLILLARYYIRFRVSRERIKAEVQIKKSEVEKMQEMDKMKSRFFANISHEFRTPLTLLLGPINDLLKNRDRLREDDWKLLGTMKRNAGKLQQQINQLLDLSKLETGNLKLEVTEGDLTGHVRALVLSFLSLAESKKISYEYELEELPGLSFLDQDKIEKIIINLISNALKFTLEGGSVLVALRYRQENENASGSHVEISVKDTGPGIPDDQKDKIFDRFYQVSNSDSGYHEGTGIGLSFVKELVELYRGEINVESEVGKGSTFSITLPVSREFFKDEEIVTIPGKSAGKISGEVPENSLYDPVESDLQQDAINEKDKDRPVILIVEDNPDLRNYISRNLFGHYQVLEAENGIKGLEKTIESIPDLVISDLMMPEMDGVEMCDRIKSDERTSHIPLIMLTARADKSSKLESLETGADDYILKPFDAEELQVRVRNLIEQRKNLRERFKKKFLTATVDQELPAPEDEFLTRVLDCIKKHLSEPEFNVEQMGKELSVSHSQLYRKILAMTDQTPNVFMRNIRLKMAARMFMEGHKNVTRVLYSVGFNTPSHFTQCFRELFGINPSTYIKQLGSSTK